MQDWPQIVFGTDADSAQALEDALFEAGALSVIYQDEHDQPILEPAPGEVRLWDNIRLVALFPLERSLDDIESGLSIALDGQLPEHQWLPLPDQQWERAWMDDFRPMQFGPKLWICPTHCEPMDEAAVNVRLDPGLAFGTGTHATTRQCLEWLGKTDVRGREVIDYGCGSGVLAVAAAMLGAKHVAAIDIDDQAIRATHNNASNNGVSTLLTIGSPEVTSSLTSDIVIANILFQPLMELAPQFANMTRNGGALVLSGLLEEHVEELMIRYTQWFTFHTHNQQGSWALLHATRQQA